MKTLIAAAIRCSLIFLIPSASYAISAQWDLDPISGDWNTAANWTPDAVPNGPADTATFGLSNTTDVFLSANTEVDSITFTAAATNPYVITVNPGVTLTLSGTGITNNSGRPQTFRIGSDDQAEVAQIHFTNSAHAGNAIIDLRSEGDLLGGSAQFSNRSSADNATIITATSSSISFFDRSTAGSASVVMGGQGSSIQFFNASPRAVRTFLGDCQIL
jgi:hypothetical protein